MSGYQIRDVCYQDAASAAWAAVGPNNGQQVVIGSISYTYKIKSVTASGDTANVVAQYVRNGSFGTINANYSFNPPPCGLLDTVDGLFIAWGIAAAWICVGAVAFLKRGIHE